MEKELATFHTTEDIGKKSSIIIIATCHISSGYKKGKVKDMESLKNKEAIKFDSAKDMFEYLLNDCDLYNLETGDYVFKYSESGSFAVYDLFIEEAEELEKKATEGSEYWGAYLGVGGVIYDDPSSDFYRNIDESNFDYCNKMFNVGTWVDVTH